MKAVVFCILAAALIFAGLRWLEHVSLYLPSLEHAAHPGSYGIRFQPLRLKTADGLTLDAWFIDGEFPSTGMDDPSLPALPRVPGRPVVLFFNGNGGNMSYRVQKLRYFKRMGASVLLFDYRGYGKSEGRPSERGTYADGRAAAAEALSRAGGDASRLVYYGESLGSAVALQTALEIPPRALILDSPFTSTAAMGKLVFPWLPSRLIVKNRYENLKKISGLKAPLLILHSPSDEIVPFEMGRALFDAAPPPKDFVETSGDHNGGFLDSARWGTAIAEFMKERLR